MWHVPWEIEAWFERLDAEREARSNSRPGAEPDETVPMMSNALSAR